MWKAQLIGDITFRGGLFGPLRLELMENWEQKCLGGTVGSALMCITRLCRVSGRSEDIMD